MIGLGALAKNASHLTALSVDGKFVWGMSAEPLVREFHKLLIEKQRYSSQEQTQPKMLLLARSLNRRMRPDAPPTDCMLKPSLFMKAWLD